MKKIFLAMTLAALMASPAVYANSGGKKKARKKAKVECKKDNCCDPKKCDPKNCDLKDCDLKNCDLSKVEKCPAKASCAGN
ncbi:MAG TPA: hypothetical protein VMZ03_03730 [Chitinophagaceae bacterium]|nr:hypothetical protein [Chitinophagaceae bacterium]